MAKRTIALSTATPLSTVKTVSVNNGMSGWYNNTLKPLLSSNYGKADLDWMIKNKQNPTGWDLNTFYDNSSLLGNSKFPQCVLNAYNAKIKVGIPFSADSEVNQAINYNRAQTDSRKRISHIVSEIEDYGNGNATPAQFKTLMENNYIKAKGAGIRFGCYNGWTKQWDMVVKNTDFLLLHCYIPSANMSSGKKLYDYLCGSSNTDRLPKIATAAKALGKIYPVSIIYSSEAAYGQTFFKTNAWTKAHELFLEYYATKATANMKSNIIIDGCYQFVTKTGKVSKP